MIEIVNETNEILLSGIVGDGWDENPITAKEVGKALKAFDNNAVTVRINSQVELLTRASQPSICLRTTAER